MRPTCDVILSSISTNLSSRFLPKAKSDSEKADIVLNTFLLGGVAEEFERAAHRRIEENDAIRKLFSESLTVIQDSDLKSRIANASETKDTDWHISILDETNNKLLVLLIELHTHVEELENVKAQQFMQKIWEALKDYAKRREFKLWETSQAMLLEARKSSHGS